jgi:hypothetical protein
MTESTTSSGAPGGRRRGCLGCGLTVAGVMLVGLVAFVVWAFPSDPKTDPQALTVARQLASGVLGDEEARDEMSFGCEGVRKPDLIDKLMGNNTERPQSDNALLSYSVSEALRADPVEVREGLEKRLQVNGFRRLARIVADPLFMGSQFVNDRYQSRRVRIELTWQLADLSNLSVRVFVDCSWTKPNAD